MEAYEPKVPPPTYQDLLEQNQALRNELAREKNIWETLVETSRKLQGSSASIKAAVSSLLNYDIFWDGSNEHEFHTTINNSIDQVSELVKLVTLQSRLKAGALEFKLESNFLPEILSVVQANSARNYPGSDLKISFPEEGSLVEVDYAYLILALDLLISVFVSFPIPEGLRIEADEEEDAWHITVMGGNQAVIDGMRLLTRPNIGPDEYHLLSPENILKLRIACGIMDLQKITYGFSEDSSEMSIVLPVYNQ